VIEGKPLSQARNGWDPAQASISALSGSITYGSGLGPVGTAIVSGLADTEGSALQQYQENGNINMGQALTEIYWGSGQFWVENLFLEFQGDFLGVRSGRLHYLELMLKRNT